MGGAGWWWWWWWVGGGGELAVQLGFNQSCPSTGPRSCSADAWSRRSGWCPAWPRLLPQRLAADNPPLALQEDRDEYERFADLLNACAGTKLGGRQAVEFFDIGSYGWRSKPDFKALHAAGQPAKSGLALPISCRERDWFLSERGAA